MKKVVFYVEFKLKKEASVADFLASSEKLNEEYMSKQKGYISWKQLNEGETWIDMVTFETMEDAKAVEENQEPHPLALEFYSFINLLTCKVHFYTIEKDYN